MPIYEYNCPKCGDFELTRKMSDTPLENCPTCNGPVTKKVSLSSFALKGSGWYKTDYTPQPACESSESGHSCCAGCKHSH